MNEFKYALSLRAFHPEMRADDIESALGIRVKVSKTVDDQRKTPKGKLLEGLNKNSYCSFELSDGISADLNDELEKWNNKFLDKKSFFKEFVESGGRFEYFLGFFLNGNSGFELSAKEMQVMQQLGIGLALDIYPNS